MNLRLYQCLDGFKVGYNNVEAEYARLDVETRSNREIMQPPQRRQDANVICPGGDLTTAVQYHLGAVK